jgi:hypothetical protein
VILMKWPFTRRQKMSLIGPVVLTDDEQQECQRTWTSLTQAEGGYYAIREDLADSFKRSIIASCMMGRAERFLILSNSQPEYRELACQAAAKACGIFPISINFYDFGHILYGVGKHGEAKEAFAEFLRCIGTETLDSVMQFALNQRNIDQATKHAREVISSQ